ncbi:hypothetical protein ACQ3G6_00645 [Allorhizobium undicola]|uniref:hypothetical protein n=1 Tax=Allorhizobium undicola TaxID=78527 RepID=UPI0012B5F0B1|nr:hypothetical protein [Allorhizobium undicola]
MPQIMPSIATFHAKIESFCEVRLAPVLGKQDYNNLSSYMLGLTMRRALPPLHAGRLNWREIGATCQLSEEGLKVAKREARHGFEALMRWINGPKKPKQAIKPVAVVAAKPFTLRPAQPLRRPLEKPAANGNTIAKPAAQPLRRVAGGKSY